MNNYRYYPAHGLGEITGQDEKFFYLFIPKTRMKLTVPINKLNDFRGLSSREDILQAINKVSDQTPRVNKNWNQRQREYQGVINTGNLVDIARVASEIKSSPTTPSFGEKKILEQCLTSIQVEAELVLGSRVEFS